MDPAEENRDKASDSEDDTLHIVDGITKSPKKRAEHPELGDALDKTIQETLEKCDNLTSDAVKKMLLKLVKNEHVLAFALLKAEEQQKVQQGKTSESDEDDKKSETDAPATPKLTRLKAKQLNQKLPVPGPLKTPELCEDVVTLIQEPLVNSDDEDENEYQPGDEIASDEDITNTTFSDVESQPSTPGSALFYNEQDFESPGKDSEFKMPRTRTLSAEEQENISRRTRSKLCLTTTAIETIESTFIPPDITTDMYDQENEIDNEWKEFLSEFMMPLTNDENDDEKSDPEYVAAESVPMDREELRPVRVSKKELNQLISELLEDTGSLFDSEPSTSSKRSSTDNQSHKNKRQRNTSSPTQKAQSPKISSRMYSQEELLNTPPLPSTSGYKRKETPSTPSNAIFQHQLQTAQLKAMEAPTVEQSSAAYFNHSPSPLYAPTSEEASKFPQITGVYGSVPSSTVLSPQPPSILVLNAHNQLELRSSANLFNQAFVNNGIMQLPQYQSIVIQVPTIDLLQNRLNLSAVVAQPQEAVSETVTEPINIPDEPEVVEVQDENLTDDKKSFLTVRKNKLNEFDYLETLEPPIEAPTDQNLKGFSYEQKEIYEQQMRMHAQLLSQHFLQLYASPKWWEKAEPLKKNLAELKEVVNVSVSPLTADHIENCLSVCTDWEKELEENNERNKKYAEFLYEEVELEQKTYKTKQQFTGRFSYRLMEHILSSKAIMYPKLLPTKPFRALNFTKIEPTNSELRLLAFAVEKFYNEQFEKLNSCNPYKIREPRLGSIARCIIRAYNSFRTEVGMYKLLETYKNHVKMNPIKYYFIHKKSPPFTHVIEDVNVKTVVAPKFLRRGLLPKHPWDDYMFSYERLQRYPYTPVEETPIDTVDLTQVSSSEDLTSETPLPSEETPETPESVQLETPTTSTIVGSSYKIEIIYDQIPKINIQLVPPQEAKSPVSSPEKISCVTLVSPLKSSKIRCKSDAEKQKNLISILKKVSDNLDKTPQKKKCVNFSLPTPPTLKRSSTRLRGNTGQPEIANTFLLTQKFFIVIESFFTSYNKNLTFRNETHPALRRVFYWTKTIDIYFTLVHKSVMMSKKRQPEVSTSTATEGSLKTKKNVSTSEEYSKKLQRKLSDNRSLIMQNDRDKCTIEKDCSYAYNYLERVKKTLIENGDDELYKQLMSMLTSFDPDSESVPDLYYKMETFLMPNYSDLMDLFLTFLLPEHATEVGKFFEHFVLTNMKNLLQKLNFFFKKQPSHMKKVYACLNELSSEPDLTMDRLKEKVFPLLKGNQLLIDWFTQLFDKPTESLSAEYESVYIKKSLSDSDSSGDNEEIHSKDLIECDNIDELNTCGVKYKNGKIMYHGTLLPAKISFLAHDAPVLSWLRKNENSLCSHEIRNHVKFNESKKADETTEDGKKRTKKVTRKYKLCDAQTLHAHAVRLNPEHAYAGEKLSDLAHLLSPPTIQNANGSGDEKNSPKKSKVAKKSGNSPKKNLNKSPSSSSGASVNASPPNSSSKALQTAKKLRNLIEDTVEEPLSKKVKVEAPEATKNAVKPAEKQGKKSPKEVPTTSRKSDDEERLGTREGWTRDEDKLILEEYKVGYSSKNELLDSLRTKLTRSRSEINGRYEFLLDIIQMHKMVKD